MKTQARVVVIGGGVVGVSTLYHLTRKGWSDVTLLERTELTAGSTWHAAGLLPLFNMSYTVGQLHKYSVDLYKRLPAETGQEVGFHVTGNLRLATSRDRMDEYHKYCGTANTIGVPFQVISPAEVKALWPLVNLGDGVAAPKIVGALYHPDDGHIAPVDLTMALRRGARMAGAEICEQTEVLGVERTAAGEWKITTNRGDIVCEHVVCATGNYARETGRKFGLDVPSIPVEHQYIVYDESAELKAYRAAGGRELAVLRESDASYYLREERMGWILGPYEKGAPARFADGVPGHFGKELFPGDLDRLLPHVEAAMKRVPCLEHAGIKTIVNGPIAYTPDGSPLVGPAWGLRNVWLNEGHSFGVTAAGGAGWQLAEWIVEGEPGIDMLGVDPRRFGAYAGRRYTVRKNEETYRNVFTIHYPDEEREDARPAKTSPVYEKLSQLGAVWGQRYGWERANWFAPPGVPRKDAWSFRRSNYFAHVGDECRRMREAVGVIDLTPFTKHEVTGPGAEDWLDSLVANKVPVKPGRIALVSRADAERRDTLRIHDHEARRASLLRRQRRRRRALRQRLPAQDAAGRPERGALQCHHAPRHVRRRRPQRARGAGAIDRCSARQREFSLAERPGDRGRTRHRCLRAAREFHRRARLGAALSDRVREWPVRSPLCRRPRIRHRHGRHAGDGIDAHREILPDVGLGSHARVHAVRGRPRTFCAHGQGRVHRQGGARPAARRRRAAPLRHA